MTLKPKMTYLRQQDTSLVSLILLRLFWFCGCVEGILLPTASPSPIGHFVLQSTGSVLRGHFCRVRAGRVALTECSTGCVVLPDKDLSGLCERMRLPVESACGQRRLWLGGCREPLPGNHLTSQPSNHLDCQQKTNIHMEAMPCIGPYFRSC